MTSSSIKLKPQFLKTISIICACIIPLLITGPFLPDLIVSSLSLWFLYYTFKNKIYYIYKNIYFLFFAIFWLVCILSSLLSDDILFSLKASLFYIRIGIFALFISYLIDQNKKILNYFYYAFIIAFLPLIIDGYFQYFVGTNLFGYPLLFNRVSSFFGNELILGSYIARLFPLFLALFIFKSNKCLLDIFFISFVSISIYGLTLISGERASFVLLNLSILFIIIFLSSYRWITIVFFIISIFLSLFLFSNDSKLKNRYHKDLVVNFISSAKDKKIFSEVHDSLIKTSFKIFLDKPILGHGPKMFRKNCNKEKYKTGIYPCDNHPHNFYFQLLAETGIVGFSFLMGLFLHFMYLSIKYMFQLIIYKKKTLSNYQICLFSGLLITIWPLTTNGNFFTNYLMLLYSLQFGFFKIKI